MICKTNPMTTALSFGREVCGDLAPGEQREWLVTNGLGGYASGSVTVQMSLSEETPEIQPSPLIREFLKRT